MHVGHPHEGAIDRAEEFAPLQQLGRPEDIAELAAYWVNGQVIYAIGGAA